LEIPDYIVVGSGCTGAMAAQTLIDSGQRVTMLDVGVEDRHYASLIPDMDFLSIRKTQQDQYRYLLGDSAESLSWGKVKTGEHLTPGRKHLLRLVDSFLPLDSDSFFPMESLAYGGLGSGWGLGCCEFSSGELTRIGLNSSEIDKAYTTVAQRIGISGNKDDASPYTIGRLDTIQPPPLLDRNNSLLLKKYQKKRAAFNKNGFYLGRPALALLTQDLGDRKKYAYRDLDFYSDKDESAYRPWLTINNLRKTGAFSYRGNLLVTLFTEKADCIEVNCLNTLTGKSELFRSKKLLLASGVLGTARIILRSSDSGHSRLPILCNPYTYIPCIQPAMIGKAAENRKMGFAQLSLFHDPQHNNMNVAMASIYSYQSLMLFRIIKEAPLNFVDGRILMQYLASGFQIMGIHHPEERGNQKYLELKADENSPTKDRLKAQYCLSESELELNREREKKFIKALRSLGSYAIKRINPGNGSSIHYAGTLPFSKTKEAFTLSPEGKLNGTSKVFVADGSGFNYLPAKGLTFTLMANAHITALKSLKNG